MTTFCASPPQKMQADLSCSSIPTANEKQNSYQTRRNKKRNAKFDVRVCCESDLATR